MASMIDSEYSLADPPADGISAVKFSPIVGDASLLCSSWDATVRLYDAQANALRHSFMQRAAALDVCWSDTNALAFCAGLDGSIRALDLQKGAESTVGAHEKAARCIAYSAVTGAIFCGSWDATVGVWDPRSATCAGSTAMPAKVFTLALTETRLIVGTAERHVLIYDQRKMHEPEQRRESSLKHQTRCIRTFPDNAGYALSSIEGRVAVEYLDMGAEAQARKYAFKCHRVGNTVFPVNCLAFHPVFGTFATGGCDGLVNLWDGSNKKRLCQLKPYPTSIASLDFSADGNLLAVASSYTFEEGERDHPRDELMIHQVMEHEVKPKPKAAAVPANPTF